MWWWAYLHTNGKLQLKKWLGDKKEYTEDCRDSPFVAKVIEPFEAPNREAAFSEAVKRIHVA